MKYETSEILVGANIFKELNRNGLGVLENGSVGPDVAFSPALTNTSLK